MLTLKHYKGRLKRNMVEMDGKQQDSGKFYIQKGNLNQMVCDQILKNNQQECGM